MAQSEDFARHAGTLRQLFTSGKIPVLSLARALALTLARRAPEEQEQEQEKEQE
jgi:hypothetical protein